MLVSPSFRAFRAEESCVVHSGLYTTVAQVLPVLLLALMWDSAYLTRLREQRRPSRRLDPDGGFRWTKPRVRVYTLSTAFVIVADILLGVLVLAGAVPDAPVVRALAVAGVVAALASLLFRVWFDVLEATRADPPDPGGEPPSG
jgi:hypothetical protein